MSLNVLRDNRLRLRPGTMNSPTGRRRAVLSTFSDELCLEVFAYLNAPELCTAAHVSHAFRRVAYDKQLWKNLCKRKWGLSWWGSQEYTLLGESLTNDWRAIYASRLLVDKRWAAGDCRVATLAGHRGTVDGLQFDDNKVVSVGEDGTLRVWDLRSQTCIRRHLFDAMAVCVQYEGSTAYVGLWNGNIASIDFRNGLVLRDLVGHAAGVRALQLCGDWIVSGAFDNTVRVWRKDTGECVRVLEHSGAVTAVQLEGQRLVASSMTGEVKMWDLDTGNLVGAIHTGGEGIMCMAFNKQYIIIGLSNGQIQCFDVHTGAPVRQFTGHTHMVACLQFYEDKLVSGSEDTTVRVWNVETGDCVAVLTGHTHGVACLQFDDTKIVSGAGEWDQTIKIWDFAYGISVDARSVVDTQGGSTLLGPQEQVVSVVEDFANMHVASMDLDSSLPNAAEEEEEEDGTTAMDEFLENDPYFDDDCFID